RAQVVTSVLGVRQMNPDILPGVAAILGSPASATLQRRVIELLGATADPAGGGVFASAYPKLAPPLQEAAFGQLIKRSDWSLSLVDALKAGQVNVVNLGPANAYRLRHHADETVARRANAVIDELRGPEVKEKNAL